MRPNFTFRKIFLLLFSFLIFNFAFLIETPATIRYVSKTGLSIPPYTTWETAADSIQECINVSVFGDTIYVANGVYEEQVVMIRGLSLIGISNDSTIIDTRALATPSSFRSIIVKDSCIFKNFRIVVSNFYPSTNEWWGTGIYIYDIEPGNYTSIIEQNKIENANRGIYSSSSNSYIYKNFIRYSNNGIELGGVILEIYPKVINNLVVVYDICIGITFGSTPYIANNIFIGLDDLDGMAGGFAGSYSGLNEIYNNLWIIEGGGVMGSSDFSYVYNNVVTGYPSNGILTGNGNVVKNNSIENITNDVFYSSVPANPIIRYNNIWNTSNVYVNVPPPDSTNISADPMFVNDTSDFHLQKYTLLIDAGDPTILDKDSTRSDIGLYGGPLGESYKYLDLLPRSPRNLTAKVDSTIITISWNRNTEADLDYYNLYRDTVANFTIDSTKLVASIEDTFYLHFIPANIESLYFKLTAVDNQANESNPSEEVGVLITSVDEDPIAINNYVLYQNYPNPFNPSTKIGYKLKERGYVKLYVYDIKGELVSVLVNQTQEAGYYEVEFDAGYLMLDSGNKSTSGGLASGVYIYQILIRNENNIPVFSDVKKMLMIK